MWLPGGVINDAQLFQMPRIQEDLNHCGAQLFKSRSAAADPISVPPNFMRRKFSPSARLKTCGDIEDVAQRRVRVPDPLC